MKYNVQNLAFLSAVIAFGSCQQHKQSTIDESGNEVIKIRKPADDTLIVQSEPDETIATKVTESPAATVTAEKSPPAKAVEIKPAVKTEKPADEVKPARAMTVKGVVKDINRGKDGYTAKIETADGQLISATVSRSNLYDAKQYRDLAVGETVKVTGNTWLLDGVNQMTVRVLQ